MRDRTASRNYSAERNEFRRQHERHRAWGLQRRHAEKLRRLHPSRPGPTTCGPTHPADLRVADARTARREREIPAAQQRPRTTQQPTRTAPQPTGLSRRTPRPAVSVKSEPTIPAATVQPTAVVQPVITPAGTERRSTAAEARDVRPPATAFLGARVRPRSLPRPTHGINRTNAGGRCRATAAVSLGDTGSVQMPSCCRAAGGDNLPPNLSSYSSPSGSELDLRGFGCNFRPRLASFVRVATSPSDCAVGGHRMGSTGARRGCGRLVVVPCPARSLLATCPRLRRRKALGDRWPQRRLYALW
ncbi:hypothetical protein BC793_11233 [Actinoplanes xinjiangensis]|uniref:Uncharacterized protein n=1 Tax=Actinoplanes xinjiangensis TaxID=512350 RepID=A0A316FTK9_9ACTN|nr:hypothetical protein BC793_11233 [Actinoplanes xinjiangensis]